MDGFPQFWSQPIFAGVGAGADIGNRNSVLARSSLYFSGYWVTFSFRIIFIFGLMNILPSSVSTQLSFNFNWGWDSFISSFTQATRPTTHLPVEAVRWCNPSPVNTLKSLKAVLKYFRINSNCMTTVIAKLILNSNYWAWHYLTPACCSGTLNCYIIILLKVKIVWFLLSISRRLLHEFCTARLLLVWCLIIN